ncbi:MAG: hypothetical protein HYZ90_03730 [Candidatus Omnitrophica bacterium]|nr:hypothetical protein [Candidatus Omnitrophota bacterium]
MRRRTLLLGLLLLCAGASASHVLTVSRQALEAGLGEIFKRPVRIQRLSLSPHRLGLHHVRLEDSSSPRGQGRPFLSIERLQIEGPLFSLRGSSGIQSVSLRRLTLSIGGVPLEAEGRVTLKSAPRSLARCEGWLTIQHPFIRGEVEVQGTVMEPVFIGWVDGPNLGLRHFVIQLILTQEGMRLEQCDIEGGWSARGTFRHQGVPRAILKLTGPTGVYELAVEPLPWGAGRWTIWLHPTSRALRSVTGSWAIRGSRLELKADLLNSRVLMNGWVSMRAPYPAHLSLDFNDVDSADCIDLVLPGQRVEAFSGRIQGRVDLEGSLHRLTSRGQLLSREGVFGREQFTLAAVHFHGMGPILQVQDSQISKPNGALLMEGMVDLRRMGKSNFFSGMRLSSVQLPVLKQVAREE